MIEAVGTLGRAREKDREVTGLEDGYTIRFIGGSIREKSMK